MLLRSYTKLKVPLLDHVKAITSIVLPVTQVLIKHSVLQSISDPQAISNNLVNYRAIAELKKRMHDQSDLKPNKHE